MSVSIFPTLPGLTYPVLRTPMWSNIVQTAVSGKETRYTPWSYPRWKWELSYSMLRQGTHYGATYTEMQQLAAFFNSRQGMFDSFLYKDADDNAVTGQALGTGDGSTVNFQLIRAFGGFNEPIFAPNMALTFNVYVNGVLKTITTDYTVSDWSSATPGIITFVTAPGNGLAVTVDFNYYFPVRFLQDSLDFSNFMKALYENKKIAFISLK